jgi:hypothetical protein
MLELRPTCENCRKALPPDSLEAMICTFECTFCASCVAQTLDNVCPNCGGGFCARPVRPRRDWVGSNCLSNYPAGERTVHKTVDREAHARLLAAQDGLPPHAR